MNLNVTRSRRWRRFALMASIRVDGVDAMARRLHAVDAAVRENRSTQAMKSMFYEEPIDTRWILHRLLRTADALIDNWSFHYGILEETDRERCYRDAMPVKALPSTEMNAAEELRIGGETVYKTESEEMPLASFDRRLCDRLATLRALELLDKELDGLASSSAVSYTHLTLPTICSV